MCDGAFCRQLIGGMPFVRTADYSAKWQLNAIGSMDTTAFMRTNPLGVGSVMETSAQ